MRVVVLGAAGRRRTEMAIVRAARALGHPCRLVDVAGWRRRLGGLADALVRRLAEGFRPDAVIFTRHAHHLEPEHIRELSAGRAGGVWYFDYAPTPAPELLELARAAGRLFVTCRSQLDAYRAAGIPRGALPPPGDGPGLRPPGQAGARPATAATSRSSARASTPTATSCCAASPAVGTASGPRARDGRASSGLPVAGGPVWGPALRAGGRRRRRSRSAPTPSRARSTRSPATRTGSGRCWAAAASTWARGSRAARSSRATASTAPGIAARTRP